MQLGHIHIKVHTLQPAVEFYQQIFDLALTEQVGDRFAFLTGNSMHHTIALQAKGEQAPSADPGATGLFHTAFEVKDKKAFAEKYRQLRTLGITPFTIDHRISWAMYFNDPAGNGLEIYVDTREQQGNAKEWLGKDRNLHEKQILEALDSK